MPNRADEADDDASVTDAARERMVARWRVSSRLRSVAAFGGSDIDLRSAEFNGDEIAIVAIAICGGDSIYLPDSVDVELTGGALFGGNDLHGGTHRPRPGAPVVRVLSLFGGTDVYRLPAAAAAGLPLCEAANW